MSMRYGGNRSLKVPKRLTIAAPDMFEALKAQQEADELFDKAQAQAESTAGAGLENDPTASLHVTSAFNRAQIKQEEANNLRKAALAKATTIKE